MNGTHISALLDDPEYVKALQRRASSNEILGTWSSLSAAQEGVFIHDRVNND
jgi:hypothetical protein